jgi:beta-galactosidase
VKPGAEYWLNLSFRLRDDTLWAEKGHEVAAGQLKIPFETMPKPRLNAAAMDKVELSDEGATVTAAGKDFNVAFDRKIGRMVSLKYGDMEVIADRYGPRLNAFRQYTDNDRNWGGNWKFPDIWYKAGLNDMTAELKSFEAEQIVPAAVKVRTHITWNARGGGFEHYCTYDVFSNGMIHIDNRVETFGELPELPKIGLLMALRGGLEKFTWYGRGPWENYPDRKTGSDMGLYESTVTDQYVNYVRPQENGNKEDVRWALLSDEQGRGLLVTADERLSVTALHYWPEQLAVGHPYELEPCEEVVLCLDHKQLGLGNSSCGPGVLKQYMVGKGPWEFGLTLQPYTPEMGNISSGAREESPRIR